MTTADGEQGGQGPLRQLIPQRHGGALLAPYPKGVSGNPAGKTSHPVIKLLKRRAGNREEAESIVTDFLALCHDEDKRLRLDALLALFDRLGFTVVREGAGTGADLSVSGDKVIVMKWD